MAKSSWRGESRLGESEPRHPPTFRVAREDKLTVAGLALAAYERALEPKRLALVPGGHFDPYLDQFPLAAAAATEWFREHLLSPGVNHS